MRCAVHAWRGPGFGHIDQGHNIRGTLCSRGATSKNFRSGTHQSGTHQPMGFDRDEKAVERQTTQPWLCENLGKTNQKIREVEKQKMREPSISVPPAFTMQVIDQELVCHLFPSQKVAAVSGTHYLLCYKSQSKLFFYFYIYVDTHPPHRSLYPSPISSQLIHTHCQLMLILVSFSSRGGGGGYISECFVSYCILKKAALTGHIIYNVSNLELLHALPS